MILNGLLTSIRREDVNCGIWSNPIYLFMDVHGRYVLIDVYGNRV